jgi:hypothetical protein
MGILDDAIREHLELKRKHGTSDSELARQESEALGPARREPAPAEQASEPTAAEPLADEDLAAAEEPAAVAPAAPLPDEGDDLEPDEEPEPDEVPAEERLGADEPEPKKTPAEPGEREDVLEETPDFLQETPEHDRLWFEQKPPRDFDFDG